MLLLCKGKIRWPLFLFGAIGAGKTWAARSLCEAVWFAQYLTVEGAMDLLMQGPWAFDGVSRARLVVLDELCGRSRDTELEYQAVKRVADLREHKPAVYISNMTPEDVAEHYDRRIHSRVCCGTVFELKGPDRRMPT